MGGGRVAVHIADAVFVHGYFVLHNAVNIPYLDEWVMLDPGGLPDRPWWRWIFAFHNEHRIVFTKILILLGVLIDGWDLVTQQALNFVLFGFLLVTLLLVGDGWVIGNRFFAVSVKSRKCPALNPKLTIQRT